MSMQQKLQEYCERAVAAHTFPGCVVGVVKDGKQFIVAAGRQTYDETAPAVEPSTIYDVASVTKSVPTASLALMLVDAGKLALDDPVTKYVPEFVSEHAGEASIHHLLTYTLIFDVPGGVSGMALADRQTFLPRLLQSPLLKRPGEHYYYTNPPAILLGLVVERIAGKPLDTLAQEWLFEPLKMDDSSFNPGPDKLARVAPSEITSRGEMRGQPHDEAAWTLRQNGIMAGNAGLFSTVPDLLRFSEMMLADGEYEGRRYLSREMMRRIVTNQLTKLHAVAGLGWEIGRPEVMGRAARPGIILKTGFTGCVVVIDTKYQAALVHLSNRTYPKRPDREPIRAFWRSINELVFER